MEELSKGAPGNLALSFLWMENLGNRDWKTLPIPPPHTHTRQPLTPGVEDGAWGGKLGGWQSPTVQTH